MTVAGSSERDIVAVTVGLRETRVAPFAGDVELTVGGGNVPEATVKLQVNGVPTVAPSVAAMVPSSRPVYVAPATSGSRRREGRREARGVVRH